MRSSDSEEFSFVNKYLPLKWDQVKVEQKLDAYSIEIEKGLYVSQETRNQYHAEFSSKYIFTDSAHKFENITVKLYDRYSQYK